MSLLHYCTIELFLTVVVVGTFVILTTVLTLDNN
jgi:hypothetical protein